MAYAERERRLLVTADDDFLADYAALERIGILFQVDDRAPPFETANVIDALADHVDQREIETHEQAFFLTADWL